MRAIGQSCPLYSSAKGHFLQLCVELREEDGKSLLDKSGLAAKVLEDLGLGGRILLIFGGRREVENIDKSQPLLPPVKLHLPHGLPECFVGKKGLKLCDRSF